MVAINWTIRLLYVSDRSIMVGEIFQYTMEAMPNGVSKASHGCDHWWIARIRVGVGQMLGG